MVGRKILVNDHPMTIVGVSEESFTGLDPSSAPEIRVPILMQREMMPESEWLHMDDRRARWVQVFARLKPGRTIQSAQASVQGLFTQIRTYEMTLPAAKDWSQYSRDRFMQGRIVVEAAPSGYSLFITHPVNRGDLPFVTLTGMVDSDLYKDNFVNFPAKWSDPTFSGVLPKGTPVAQCVPVKRENWNASFETITGDAVARLRETANAVGAEPGAYRRHFRVTKR